VGFFSNSGPAGDPPLLVKTFFEFFTPPHRFGFYFGVPQKIFKKKFFTFKVVFQGEKFDGGGEPKKNPFKIKGGGGPRA